MKIVFISNFMNHHQRPFVESLAKNGCDVTFVELSQMSEERKTIGYSSELEFGRLIQCNKDTAREIYDMTMAADAVIFGSKPKKLFRARVNSGRLTFNFSERLFKKHALMAFSPVHQVKLRKIYLFDRKNVPYLLAAGAYSAQDYRTLGYPKQKTLKWGYFPPLTQTPLSELMHNKEKNTIIWVARFIEWKHPEYVLELAKYLKKKRLPFHIKMVGAGALFAEVQRRIKEQGLTDCVELTGPLPPQEVRDQINKSSIAVMTSDRNEGWGAVCNEAMNGGCAFVAYKGIGATTYLINDGENGMTYKTKKELFRKVEQLLKNPEQCKKLGENAYRTITDTWNYEIAAKRFMEFVEDQTIRHTSGPMSAG